jgi:hypothetical protein
MTTIRKLKSRQDLPYDTWTAEAGVLLFKTASLAGGCCHDESL